MKYEEYKQLVIEREKRCLNEYPKMLHAVMGLNGEAGECIDLLKKTLFQGHGFEKDHFLNELGDVCWYIILLVSELGVNNDLIFDKEYKFKTVPYENKQKIKCAIGFILELNRNCGKTVDIFRDHKNSGEISDCHIQLLRDIVFDVRVTAALFDKTLEDIFEINSIKMKLRYPNGFEIQKSINRGDNL